MRPILALALGLTFACGGPASTSPTDAGPEPDSGYVTLCEAKCTISPVIVDGGFGPRERCALVADTCEALRAEWSPSDIFRTLCFGAIRTTTVAPGTRLPNCPL